MAPGVGVCVWDHARHIVRLPHFFAGEGRPWHMWRVSPSEGRGRCRAQVGGLATAPEGRGAATRSKVLRALLQAHPGVPCGEEGRWRRHVQQGTVPSATQPLKTHVSNKSEIKKKRSLTF